MAASTSHMPLHKRLGWFVLYWAMGVLALGVVALALRLVMTAAGLSP